MVTHLSKPRQLDSPLQRFGFVPGLLPAEWSRLRSPPGAEDLLTPVLEHLRSNCSSLQQRASVSSQGREKPQEQDFTEFEPPVSSEEHRQQQRATVIDARSDSEDWAALADSSTKLSTAQVYAEVLGCEGLRVLEDQQQHIKTSQGISSMKQSSAIARPQSSWVSRKHRLMFVDLGLPGNRPAWPPVPEALRSKRQQPQQHQHEETSATVDPSAVGPTLVRFYARLASSVVGTAGSLLAPPLAAPRKDKTGLDTGSQGGISPETGRPRISLELTVLRLHEVSCVRTKWFAVHIRLLNGRPCQKIVNWNARGCVLIREQAA